MRPLTTAALSLVLLSQQSIALAHQGGHRGSQKLFEALDTNKDSLLSKDEVKSNSRLTEAFDEIDSNKDSYISAAELKAFRKAQHTHYAPKDSPSAPAE